MVTRRFYSIYGGEMLGERTRRYCYWGRPVIEHLSEEMAIWRGKVINSLFPACGLGGLITPRQYLPENTRIRPYTH